MDAIVGVWLTSFIGAAAFSAAGYVLGQRGVVLPLLGLDARPDGTDTPGRRDLHTMPTPVAAPPSELTAAPTTTRSPASTAETASAAVSAHLRDTPKASPVVPQNEAADEDEDRPTLVPDTVTQAEVVAKSVATTPPRSSSIHIDMLEIEATKADLQAALSKADSAMQRARAAEAVKIELERQIESLRAELRSEVVAHAAVSARADELGDRLASASEEASSLRHKVSILDRQARQLREALQGRVRALTTSEWHRRRDLEDAEEMRVKLRDVSEKLERSSMPPPPSSNWPDAVPPAVPRAMRPNGDEQTALHEEVARLTKENRELRARALGNMPAKQRSRGSIPDLDLDVVHELVGRVGSVAGLRGVVVADEMGSVLVGSGELAEGMAAFGAYIRDASARADRLLPLEGVEEIDIRDRKGMLLSTRVVAHGPSEFCVVLLGAEDASLIAAKKIVADHLPIEVERTS
jgi:hypothetical protein